MKTVNGIIFWFLSLTWGAIMTALGACVALVLIWIGIKPKRFKYFIYFEVGKGWGGVEFGAFFVVAKDCGEHTILHEAGHGIQNIIFGVFQPLISLASAVRYHYRNYLKKKKPEKFAKLPGYDDIWFEKMATEYGYKYFK